MLSELLPGNPNKEPQWSEKCSPEASGPRTVPLLLMMGRDLE